MYLFWLEVNYFTILYWFSHTSTCICHRYTRVPHPEPPSLLPPHTIPLCHLSVQTVVSLKILESPLDCKVKSVNPKGNQFWKFTGRTVAEDDSHNTLAIWYEELIHWKKTMMLGKIEAGGQGNDRGWNGWMASLTRWTWVWVKSRSWWWTGKPGVLKSMGSQRVRHGWATELNWETNTTF